MKPLKRSSSARATRYGWATAATVVAAVSLTGCGGALDSFTGNQEMRWVGKDVLPKDAVQVDDYKAAPALPDLTPRDAMKAFGLTGATKIGPELAEGEGWQVQVGQSPFATSVLFTSTCKETVEDADEAIDAGTLVLSSLGAEADDWSWFTVTDATGVPRAIAEPNIEGHQTWATGAFNVMVDQDGVCAASGTLMRFVTTGGVTHLDSAYDVFQEARHTEGLAIEGEYDQYEQTWTLASEGALVPLWGFRAGDKGIVAVDLGDGLETALDTESSLKAGLEGSK